MIIERAGIVEQKRLSGDVFRTVFKSEIPKYCSPGQFVMVGTGSGEHLLKRPISICLSDPEKGNLTLVYRKAGYGTGVLSEAREGDVFDITGPLGKGFPIEKAAEYKRVILIAGGIGAPPLLGLAGSLILKGVEKERITAVLGYRSSSQGLFLTEEFKECAETIISTDDGSAGYKGTVMDALLASGTEGDIIFSCGPLPLLRAVKGYAEEKNIPAYISLEERMACGMGVCLGCVTKTVHKDSHSMVKNARVCAEGPVFDAKEVDI